MTLSLQMENFDKLRVNLDEKLDDMCKEVPGGGQEGNDTVALKKVGDSCAMREYQLDYKY